MAGVAAALGVAGLGTVAEVEPLAAPDRRAVARRDLRARAAARRAHRGRPRARARHANPFYAAAPPPLPFVVWSIAWIAIVLTVAAWAFERRDL